MEILNKAFTAIAAAVLGWLLISLPKVTRNTMTWQLMLSSIGIAAVVGFVTNSVISNWLPSFPEDVRCSVAAIMGAQCDKWIMRYNRFMETAADKAEEIILHTTHHDNTAEKESQLNDGPEKDAE